MAVLTPRRARTREQLIDAALAVFQETGVAQASIERISEEAGFTRGAFYSNFADKDDLIVAVFESDGQRQIGRLRQLIEDTKQGIYEGDEAEGCTLPAHVGDEQAEAAAFRQLIAQLLETLWSGEAAFGARALVFTELRLYALRRPVIARRLIQFERSLSTEYSNVVHDALERYGRAPLVSDDELVLILATLWQGVEGSTALADAAQADARDSAESSRHFVRLGTEVVVNLTRVVGR